MEKKAFTKQLIKQDICPLNLRVSFKYNILATATRDCAFMIMTCVISMTDGKILTILPYCQRVTRLKM